MKYLKSILSVQIVLILVLMITIAGCQKEEEWLPAKPGLKSGEIAFDPTDGNSNDDDDQDTVTDKEDDDDDDEGNQDLGTDAGGGADSNGGAPAGGS